MQSGLLCVLHSMGCPSKQSRLPGRWILLVESANGIYSMNSMWETTTYWHNFPWLDGLEIGAQKNGTFLVETYKLYCGVLSKWERVIKMRAAFLSPILPWVMKEGESKKAALILMKNYHFDRTLRYLIRNIIELRQTSGSDLWDVLIFLLDLLF